jgi:dihydrofolate reductase
MNFDIVVACDSKLGIGKAGGLPWRLKEDMANFRKLTTEHNKEQNAVIMGRVTWESIPEKFRPLPDRLNIVVTRDASLQLPEAVLKANSFDQALSLASKHNAEKCFVLGGGQIYHEAIGHKNCQRIFLTQLDDAYDCDTFFPTFAKDFIEESCSEPISEPGGQYCFKVLKKSF